jgi:hypothetical protein
MARLSLLYVSDRLNAYTSQKKGAVSERVLGLVDPDKVEGVVIPDSIQYTVSQDEHRAFRKTASPANASSSPSAASPSSAGAPSCAAKPSPTSSPENPAT